MKRMFPYINDYFRERGIDNYKILLFVGILAALFMFRVLASRTKLDAATYNFYLLNGIASTVAGLFSAMLFQAIYNYIETGVFELKGMTVMGGIVGAAIFFTLFTLVAGLTKFGRPHKAEFWTAVNLIIPCIVLAQCIGRIGCFSAGCCYGKETDSPLGVIFVKGYLESGTKVMHENPRLPTQAFEAAFLLLLFSTMLIVMFRYKKKNLSMLMYLYLYPIFRFFIEFLRDDHRGAFFLGLSPSQIQCIIMLMIGIALTVLIYHFKIIPLAKSNSRVNESSNEGNFKEAERVEQSAEIKINFKENEQVEQITKDVNFKENEQVGRNAKMDGSSKEDNDGKN